MKARQAAERALREREEKERKRIQLEKEKEKKEILDRISVHLENELLEQVVDETCKDVAEYVVRYVFVFKN